MNQRQARVVIERALKRWRPITGHDRWALHYKWEDPEDELEGRTMGCSAQPEYTDATIRFVLSRIAMLGQSAKETEYDVLHELCHCLVWALSDLAGDRRGVTEVRRVDELAVSQIARALWVAKYGEEPPA